MTRPNWTQQWEPNRRRPSSLSFGADDGPAQVVRLDGGWVPPPVPPGYQGGPPGTLQTIQVIEPNEGWWLREGAFAFKHTGAVPDTEGAVIALTEQLHLPGPPAPWWVQWFRYNRNLDQGEGDSNFELRGRITYGTGGTQNIFECDVMQGLQMPIVCNSIKVELVTYNPLPEEAYAAGACVVGAMFGKGSAGISLPPTWTTPFALNSLVAPGELIRIPLPDFARALTFHTTEQPGGAQLTGSFIDFEASGNVLKTINCNAAYEILTAEGGIAIPGGTNEVVLRVPAAITTERYALQFALAL